MKQIANGITVGRIIMSLLMLATAPFSDAFYGLAAFCGISDMIDGPVARKTESAGKIGAMLDSIADLIFTIVIVLKCLPVIRLERWMWIWTVSYTHLHHMLPGCRNTQVICLLLRFHPAGNPRDAVICNLRHPDVAGV